MIKNIQFDSITLEKQTIQMPETQTSFGKVNKREVVVLTLTDTNGLSVQSECSALNIKGYSDETLDLSIEALQNTLIPFAINTPMNPENAKVLLDTQLNGFNFAKSAIEMGVWALCAKQNNQTLTEYIEGNPNKKRPKTLAIGIQKSIEDLNVVLSQIPHDVAHLKLKIQPNYLRDIVVPTLLDHQNLGRAVWLDANGSFDKDSVDELLEMSKIDIIMIEQPFSQDNELLSKDLQTKLNIPICLDESINSLEDVIQMHIQKSGQAIMLKPPKVGGISESIKILDYCKTHNVPVYIGGMWEGEVGARYLDSIYSLLPK